MKTLTFYSIADLQAALVEAEKYHALYEATEKAFNREHPTVSKPWQEVYASYLFEMEGANVEGQHTVLVSPLPQRNGFTIDFQPMTKNDVWAGDSEDIEDELNYYRRH